MFRPAVLNHPAAASTIPQQPLPAIRWIPELFVSRRRDRNDGFVPKCAFGTVGEPRPFCQPPFPSRATQTAFDITQPAARYVIPAPHLT